MIVPSKGLLIGDSTISARGDLYGIENYMLTGTDLRCGTVIDNIAMCGDTINGQLLKYDMLPNKESYDWIIVQIGLNDLDGGEKDTIPMIINRYQILIDFINATKNPDCILIVSSMINARSFFTDQIGRGQYYNADSWQKEQALNNAIMGIIGTGCNYITGCDYRNDRHVGIISNEHGDMYDYYGVRPISDKLHPGEEGRKVIACVFRELLSSAGFLREEKGRNLFSTFPVSGKYIPLISAIDNVESHTVFESAYIRIGDAYMISGMVFIKPLTVNQDVTISIGMPFSVLFNRVNQLVGQSTSSEIKDSGGIRAGTETQTAILTIPKISSTQMHTHFFNFTAYI